MNIFQEYRRLKMCGLTSKASETIKEHFRYQINVRKWPPLHRAVIEENINDIKVLIRSGEDVSCTNEENATPLIYAVALGSLEIVKTLLDFGAEINCADNNQYTPLHISSQYGQEHLIETLIQHGANINAQDINYHTPLHVAVCQGYPKNVSKLLEYKPNINSATKILQTALHLAAISGKEEITKKLISHNADVNALDKKSHTPLALAAVSGHANVVNILIMNGADIELANEDTYTPLHLAIQKSHINVVKVLLSKKAEVNSKTKNKRTAMQMAIQQRKLDIINLLLEFGADIHLTMTSKDWTPLHFATSYGDPEIVELLIEKKADIHWRCKRNMAAIHVGAIYGYIKIVDILIKNGVDVTCKTDLGQTPLHLASENGHLELAQTFIKMKANINERDINLRTPLHLAAIANYNASVELLLAYKCSVNMQDKDGYTALHYSAQTGNHIITETLVKGKVDPNILNNNSKTALDLAEEEEHLKVIEQLSKCIGTEELGLVTKAVLEKNETKLINLLKITDAWNENSSKRACQLYVQEFSEQGNRKNRKDSLRKKKPNVYNPCLTDLTNREYVITLNIKVYQCLFPSIIEKMTEIDSLFSDGNGNNIAHLAAGIYFLEDICWTLFVEKKLLKCLEMKNNLGNTPMAQLMCTLKKHFSDFTYTDELKKRAFTCIDLMVASNPDIDTLNNSGRSPIQTALLNDDESLLNRLIKGATKITHFTDDDFQNALDKGYFHFLRHLIPKLNPDTVISFLNVSRMNYIVLNAPLSFVNFTSAIVDFKNGNKEMGDKLLQSSYQTNNVELFKTILQNNKLFDNNSILLEDGETYLTKSLIDGKKEFSQAILSSYWTDKFVNIANSSGSFPVHLALKCNQLELVSIIAGCTENIDVKDAEGNTVTLIIMKNFQSFDNEKKIQFIIPLLFSIIDKCLNLSDMESIVCDLCEDEIYKNKILEYICRRKVLVKQ